MIDDRRSKVDLEEARHRERKENLEKAYKRLAAAEKTIKTSLTSA
jgi:hypothetical protein